MLGVACVEADSCAWSVAVQIPTLKDDAARHALLSEVARLLGEDDPVFSSDEESVDDAVHVGSGTDPSRHFP